jgi:hypothetical protein
LSQHDLNIANQGFPAFRADLNDALVALGSTNSGATAPATTFANQLWYDTANNILKIRNEDNDAWISLLTLNQVADAVSAIGSISLSSISDVIANAVTLTGTQTLTNKTLTTPKINVINEETTNSGVTVDGLLIKDGKILSSGLPVGSVLQVVQGTTNTQVSTSGTSYVDTNLSASITPTSSSSKILVLVSQTFGVRRNDPYAAGRLGITRNSTVLHFVVWDREFTATRNEFLASPSSISVLDSPATTSAVTYKTQIACVHGVSSEEVFANTRTATATIILMEISA